MYAPITFPLGAPHKEWTAAETERHWEWFRSSISQRVTMLEDQVRHELPNWSANGDVDSLVPLGEWLVPRVTTKTLKRSTVNRLNPQIPVWIAAVQDVGVTLTTLSMSYSVDCCIYLGECLR